MKRLGRLRFFVYSTLTVLVLLGGARLVLSSDFVAGQVAERFAVLIGVPVRVSGVDIALGGNSSVQGIQIFEAENARPGIPWVIADEMRADFSAVDMFSEDAMPKDVVLSGASIQLRFSEDGDLLTRLPRATDSTKRMPRIRLENARITINQAGREKLLVVNGVTADFTYADNTFHFEGTCADEVWGQWTVNGSYATANGGVFQLHLKTDRAEVDEAKLPLLPFVPVSVWQKVRIFEGATSAEMNVTVRSEEPTVRYRIALRPTNVRLHVSAIELDADQTSGEVLIEDSVVRLSKVKGRTANGSIGTEASLDFREDNALLQFEKIWVENVDLNRLPDSWKMKEYKITVKLTGKTNLKVLVTPTGVRMNGDGEILVRKATDTGENPAALSLKIKIVGDHIELIVPEYLKPFLKLLAG